MYIRSLKQVPLDMACMNAIFHILMAFNNNNVHILGVECALVSIEYLNHSYDILGARMLWKPKEARILKNFIEF
jgi:hypothetical protein